MNGRYFLSAKSMCNTFRWAMSLPFSGISLKVHRKFINKVLEYGKQRGLLENYVESIFHCSLLEFQATNQY